MSNTKTEAQRLAEFKDLEYWPAGVGLTDWVESVCAEILRLDAALADELNNRDVLDKMLTQCITDRDQLRAQVERLLKVCMDYIEHHELTCAESIYQKDAIYESAPELVEQICDVIGYYPSGDDDEQ